MGLTRFATLAVLLVLLAPLAAAAPDVPPVQAPDGAAALGHALQQTSGAVAAGASSVGHGASAAASAVGAALGSVAHAISAAASAVGHAVGAAIGATLTAIGQLLTFLGLQFARAGAWVARHPMETANATGATLSLAGIAWWLKRALGLGGALGLYTRLAPGEILDNEARAKVYAHIQSNPGAHPSAISETLGIGWGTTVYHLSKLEQGGLVTSRHAHAKKCYFAIDGSLDVAGRDAVAAMAGEKARDIVGAVRASPGITQKALADALGMSQALASWHVKRLVASGVLRVERSGRSNTLTVADHVPAAPLAAA